MEMVLPLDADPARLALPQQASDFGSATIGLQLIAVGLWARPELALWASPGDCKPGNGGARCEAPRVSLEVLYAAL